MPLGMIWFNTLGLYQNAVLAEKILMLKWSLDSSSCSLLSAQLESTQSSKSCSQLVFTRWQRYTRYREQNWNWRDRIVLQVTAHKQRLELAVVANSFSDCECYEKLVKTFSLLRPLCGSQCFGRRSVFYFFDFFWHSLALVAAPFLQNQEDFFIACCSVCLNLFELFLQPPRTTSAGFVQWVNKDIY